jgi:hypothetical protein
MNCKPGDLAVVIRSETGNLGKIVRCIAVASKEQADQVRFWACPMWEVDRPMQWEYQHEVFYERFCPDDCLRPIRPQSDDATDEMTLIAGKPESRTRETV